MASTITGKVIATSAMASVKYRRYPADSVSVTVAGKSISQ